MKEKLKTLFKSLAEKLQKFLAELRAVAKLQPTIFITMLFNIGYGLTTAIISLARLSFFIGITGSYSLILGIAKFYALKKYKRARSLENESEAKKLEMQSAKNITVCAAAISFLHFSFAIVSTFFHDESPSVYTLWFIYYVAGSAFIKILLAAVNAIKTRKSRSAVIRHLKLTDVANAFIALALTQRAILYFVGEESAKIASGIGGLFFSLCAGLVCLYMFKVTYTATLGAKNSAKD